MLFRSRSRFLTLWFDSIRCVLLSLLLFAWFFERRKTLANLFGMLRFVLFRLNLLLSLLLAPILTVRDFFCLCERLFYKFKFFAEISFHLLLYCVLFTYDQILFNMNNKKHTHTHETRTNCRVVHFTGVVNLMYNFNSVCV